MSFLSRLIPTRRRVVTYLAVLASLLVIRLGLGWWAGHELQKTIDRIGPLYGGLSLRTLERNPHVPREQNRAKVVAAAGALVVHATSDSSTNDGKLNALLFNPPHDPAARIAYLRDFADNNALALQVLAAAESRTQSDWEVRYSDEPHAQLPSLMEIRWLARASQSAGVVDLNDGRPDEAIRHVRLGLVVAASLAPEGNFLMQLIRVGIDQEHFEFLRQVLAEGKPTSAALATLAPAFATALDRGSAVGGVIGEMKYFNAMLEQLESGNDGREELPLLTDMVQHSISWIVKPAMLAIHAHALDQAHRTVEFARLEPHVRQARKLALPTNEPKPWWWWKRLSATFSWEGLGSAVGRSLDDHETMARLASAAVALRRFKLEHAAYPPSLDALVPAFMSKVPRDPATGQPLKYETQGDGFSLAAEAPPGAPRPQRFTWVMPR